MKGAFALWLCSTILLIAFVVSQPALPDRFFAAVDQGRRERAAAGNDREPATFVAPVVFERPFEGTLAQFSSVLSPPAAVVVIVTDRLLMRGPLSARANSLICGAAFFVVATAWWLAIALAVRRLRRAAT